MNMEKTWVNSAVVYNIYPLGFCGAPKTNDGNRTPRILDLLKWAGHIKGLGCNAILLNPFFQSSTHGYDVADYYDTDCRLGTKEDFKKVFDGFKAMGFRIIVDGVFNHVGRDFWAFKDLLEKKWDSPYKNWFADVDFGRQSPLGDPFSYGNWEGHWELVKLNLWNEDVCRHIFDAVRMWIRDFDIDGIRVDAANCIGKGFIGKLKGVVRELKPDFWLMGELIHGDYSLWMGDGLLDSATNYECWKGIYSSHNDKNYFEIAYAFNRQSGAYGIYKGRLLYNFLDNHDVSRIATLLKDKRDVKNCYTLLFTMIGVPAIYYGSEFGIEAEKRKCAGGDDAIRPRLELESLEGAGIGIQEHIAALAKLKREREALQTGSYRELLLRNQQYVFARESPSGSVIVCLNCSDGIAILDFNYDGRAFRFELEPHSSHVETV
ncbi:MAG TPA: alpha-amylase [Spirochaetaceae bacterium]|nr:alpha-amylase [Spirochaetaceae bacterium]